MDEPPFGHHCLTVGQHVVLIPPVSHGNIAQGNCIMQCFQTMYVSLACYALDGMLKPDCLSACIAMSSPIMLCIPFSRKAYVELTEKFLV